MDDPTAWMVRHWIDVALPTDFAATARQVLGLGIDTSLYINLRA